MPQLFSPRSGFLLRLVLLGVLLAAGSAVSVWRGLTAYPAGRRDAIEQPVPFSHKHHAGDDGIDCRYCHSSVETSAFAGMPPLSTCMTCHSQLFTDQAALAPLVKAYLAGVPLHWQRVHMLPDFVYFNHSIHIAKGIGCASCHGAVDEMPLTWRVAPLTMRWCLDCHRQRAGRLRPARLTECSVCHR